jgi:hypothetical protein
MYPGGQSLYPPGAPGGPNKSHALVFIVNGKPVSYKCPIIQAIGVLGVEGSEAGSRRFVGGGGGGGGGAGEETYVCRRAWEQVP